MPDSRLQTIRVQARLAPWAAVLVLVILVPLYWKLRIIDTAVSERPALWTGDVFAQFHPMVEYGFRALASGKLPLWNPYQLCGEPFLGIAPYAGLFYPLNIIYLRLNAATAIEVGFIVHMLLGALSMVWLAREFGISFLGGLGAAVTFVWSGWLMFNANQPPLFNGMCWMPITVLLADRVARGRRLAWLWLVAAVACQILQGAMEVALHVLYAAALFGVVRLGQLLWWGRWRDALWRGGVLLACVVAGTLLAAPQLLPTLELLSDSARSPGMLSFEQTALGAVPPRAFAAGALGDRVSFYVALGFLPLLSMVLVLGDRRHLHVWLCAAGAVVGATLLVWGEPVYRLYYALPFGKVFRRPMKFLDIYAFGQALLVGLALTRLQAWSVLERRRLWRQPAWLAACAFGALLIYWRHVLVGSLDPSVPALLLVLVLFGAVKSARVRLGLVAVLAMVHGAALFFGTANFFKRPFQAPDVFTRYDDALRFVQALAGYDRTYVYNGLSGELANQVPWGILGKQMRNGVFMVTDYEALVPGRYKAFFEYVTTRPQDRPFIGGYALGASSRWRMMDLTGTKYFLAYRGDLADAFLAHSAQLGGPAMRRIRDAFVRVYERDDGLSRAYFVPRGRVIRDPTEVLATLNDPQFDPRTDVILEDDTAGATSGAPIQPAPGHVQIIGYEPERVQLTVDAQTPGFLVLSDLHYPGWKAFVDDDEVPILRANYLFRAVHLDPGSWVVRFEYHPASLRNGVWISAATLLCVVVVLALAVARRRHGHSDETPTTVEGERWAPGRA
jgi:hypothetical protein